MDNLCINALGEVFLNDRDIAGTVNVDELARRLGRDPTNADLDAEFESQLDEGLPPDQAKVAKLVWQAQKELNDSQFRVQYFAGAIRVSTEFVAFDDDPSAWLAIYGAASKVRAEVWIMHNSPHLDHWWDGDGKEQFGEHHGRMETQVDVHLRCDATIESIREQRRRLKEVTNNLFLDFGVGVI